MLIIRTQLEIHHVPLFHDLILNDDYMICPWELVQNFHKRTRVYMFWKEDKNRHTYEIIHIRVASASVNCESATWWRHQMGFPILVRLYLYIESGPWYTCFWYQSLEIIAHTCSQQHRKLFSLVRTKPAICFDKLLWWNTGKFVAQQMGPS